MARTQGSHSDITGPRIRRAALRLFARQGFAAVSMRQIAGEVGVQAGALYNYTPDKQTLLFQLMRAHLEEVIAAWAETDPKGAPADLSPAAFGPGEIRRTRLGQVACAFWQTGPETFELICFRSVGAFVGDWLAAAARRGPLPGVL